MTDLDYPSQAAGKLGPPEPMLLDTCVVQNIEWVWDRIEEDGGQWTDERIHDLKRHFGEGLAGELLALGFLVDKLQWNGYPWLVSASSLREIQVFRGLKADKVFRGWHRLYEHQEDWHHGSSNGAAPGILNPGEPTRISPLILQGLGVSTAAAIVADDGPLKAFHDEGDRKLIRDALLGNVPAILTTDLRSFWAHRSVLYDYELEVWKPSDALLAYESRWARQVK